MPLEAIVYKRGSLEILDQLRLPHEEVYLSILTVDDAWSAIRTMQVRGAPAIAIVAALSLAVELTSLLNTREPRDAEEVEAVIKKRLAYLITSRPTAVNLADAVGKLSGIVRRLAEEGRPGREVAEGYVVAAEQMLVDDVSDNMGIGKHGADWILRETAAGKGDTVSVLTHCNTGYVGWISE